jgi:hypothetical protein
VDLSRPNLKIDVVARDNGTKSLGDPAQFNDCGRG